MRALLYLALAAAALAALYFLIMPSYEVAIIPTGAMDCVRLRRALLFDSLAIALGRWRHLRLAADLDPTTSRVMGAARISYYERAFRRARQELTEASAVDRAARTWIVWNSEVALGLGDYARAESLLATPGRDDPTRPLVRAVLYARTSRKRAARVILDSLAATRGASVAEQAAGWAAVGEKERALDLIDRAVAQHDAFVVDFKVDPLLDPLRSESRFQAVMRKLNFIE